MSEIDWQHRELLMGWSRLAAQGHEGAQLVMQQHREQLPAQGVVQAVMQNAKLRGVIQPPAARATEPAPWKTSPALSALVTRLSRVNAPKLEPLDDGWGVNSVGLHGEIGQ